MLALTTEKPESPKGFLSKILGLKEGGKGLGTDKFSSLLKTFSLGKTDTKDFLFATDIKDLKLGIQTSEGSIKKAQSIDPLTFLKTSEEKEAPKASNLLALLSIGKEDAPDEEQLSHELLKALPLTKGDQILKTLIGEAKSYLKDQILQKQDIKDLPKTLGGLIKLAQNIGIDVKAIRLDSLPASKFNTELAKVINTLKPQVESKSLSTNDIIKPLPLKEAKEAEKPLTALLNKTSLSSKASEIVVANSNAISIVKTKEVISISPEPIIEGFKDTAPRTAKTVLAALQTLLHGEQSQDEEGEISLKTDSLKESEKPHATLQAKTEQLTQKITEAKQLIQHVSQNIKDSVENYKPPFTRIKMQLNPQKFGDMEVTLIQRGNNVHININASPSALTVMMQNSHELRAQLSAHGLGDASMNFNSQQQDQSQQQHKHKQEQGGLSYEEFQDFKEDVKEIATSLEIVLPRYV